MSCCWFPKITDFGDVKESPRYEQIKKIVSKEGTVRYLSFVLCNTLWNVLEKISNNAPSKHIYRNEKPVERYEQINQIKKYLHNLQNRNKAKVSAIELLLIDDIEKKYFKSLKSLDIDTKAKNIFPASDVLDMCRHPLPGCIQNTDKNQPSMSYVGYRYI